MSDSSRSSPLLSSPGTTPPINEDEKPRMLERVWSAEVVIAKEQEETRQARRTIGGTNTKRKSSAATSVGMSGGDDVKRVKVEGQQDHERVDIKPTTVQRTKPYLDLLVYDTARPRRSRAPSHHGVDPTRLKEVKVEETEDERRRTYFSQHNVNLFEYYEHPDLRRFEELDRPRTDLPEWVTSAGAFTRPHLGGNRQVANTGPGERGGVEYLTARSCFVKERQMIKAVWPGMPFLDKHASKEGDFPFKDRTTFISQARNEWIYMGNYSSVGWVHAKDGEFSAASLKAQERAIDSFMGYDPKKASLAWLYKGGSREWLRGCKKGKAGKRQWIREKLKKNEFINGYMVMFCTGWDCDRAEVVACQSRRDGALVGVKEEESSSRSSHL